MGMPHAAVEPGTLCPSPIPPDQKDMQQWSELGTLCP